MPKYAVVVDGICDCTTVVVVDADNMEAAEQQAAQNARSVPSNQWEHGEISPVSTTEIVLIQPRPHSK